MWPFKKKKTLPGITKDKNGELKVEFTDEEKNAIELSFKSLDRYGIRKEYIDEATNAFIARGLSIYAWQQIEHALETSENSLAGKYIDKAVAAISKAYTFHDLPIYMYDFGYFCELGGREQISIDLYKNFLSLNENYVPNELDEFILHEKDLEKAIFMAKEKIHKAGGL